MSSQPRPASRASRVPARSGPARTGPAQRRPAGSTASAEEILQLQRAAGNHAANLAIQRLGLFKGKNKAPVEEELAVLPKTLLNDENGVGRYGKGAAQAGTGVGVAGSTLSQDGFKAASADVGPVGTALGGIGDTTDLLTARQKKSEAVKDAADAAKSGSAFWQMAANRKAGMETTKVRLGYAKMAGNASKVAGAGVSAAQQAGDISSHAAGIGTAVTGGFVLPVTLASAARDLWQLVSQGRRLGHLNDLELAPITPDTVQEAQELRAAASREADFTQRIIDEATEQLRVLEREFEECKEERGLAQDPVQGPDRESRIRLENRQLAAMKADIDGIKHEIGLHEVEVARHRKTEEKAAEAYRLMTSEVTSAAEDARRLERGESPSLQGIARYAKLKNAGGAVRKFAKVISSGLGLAAGIVAVFVAATGIVLSGPVGLGLTASAAALGLSLAAYSAWRFLSKRFALTQDAYVEAKDEDGGTTFKKIEGFWARAGATLSFRTKLYKDKDGKEEKKSHRKLMAEALWDYATSDAYPGALRRDAWSLIAALTGKPRDKFEEELQRRARRSADVEEGRTKAALKLLEDKLKSA